MCGALWRARWPASVYKTQDGASRPGGGRERLRRSAVGRTGLSAHRGASARQCAARYGGRAGPPLSIRHRMVHPDRVVDEKGFADLPLVEPVYPLTEGLAPGNVRRAMEGALARLCL